jgi:uncharacterized protein (TIGR02996 family)
LPANPEGDTAVTGESERKAFLKALAANEDDTTTRLVYADWLDERGEHEEADRMRKWDAAKAWLVGFFEAHNQGDYVGELNTYTDLLELARVAVEEANERGFGFDCGSNERLCEALRANPREFWENWSVVTGIPVPPDADKKSYFGCSC